jgi:hypothetical protein
MHSASPAFSSDFLLQRKHTIVERKLKVPDHLDSLDGWSCFSQVEARVWKYSSSS